jgi:hypothetical protein
MLPNKIIKDAQWLVASGRYDTVQQAIERSVIATKAFVEARDSYTDKK